MEEKKILLTILIFTLGLSTILVHADDGGGGGGNSGGNSGGGVGFSTGGVEYFWFDEGGWQDSTSGGSKVEPKQGVYYKNMSTVPDKMYNLFWNGIKEKINNKSGNRWVVDLGYDINVNNPARYQALRDAMTKACQNAINRSGNPNQGARVVGIAVTWHVLNTGGYIDNVHYNGWQIGGYTSNPTYATCFSNKAATANELKDAYGWGTAVNQTKYSNALANEKWRDYIYRIGSIDAPTPDLSSSDHPWAVYAVAVTDEEPLQPAGKGKLIKTIGDLYNV